MEMLKQKAGIVAILDALGAATYDDTEIQEFLKARSTVIQLLNDKAESVAATLDVSQVKTYTFNDTMLIVMESHGEHTCRAEIEAFATILRKVLVDSLKRKIMFRGSFAVGYFYEDSETNTILGKAVTDAAAWYDKADWIGILATPRTTVHIDHLMESNTRNWGHLLVRYAVPLTDGSSRSLWAVNWPKVFWVRTLTPCHSGEKPRECFLDLLGHFAFPRGTEGKHFHAISFFDHVMSELELGNAPTKGRTVRVPRGGSRAGHP
jgi:hypothetical protein